MFIRDRNRESEEELKKKREKPRLLPANLGLDWKRSFTRGKWILYQD